MNRTARQQLIWCTVSVVALHVGVLAWPKQSSRPFASVQPPPLQARWLALAPPVGIATHAAVDEPRPVRGLPSRSDAAPAAGVSSANAGETAVAAAGGFEVPMPPGTLDGDYLPRSALSVVPRAMAPVELGFPEGGDDGGVHEAELSLFIDPSGRVRRVRVDRGDLPEALAQAAREAFLSARFSPGEVDGEPVFARLRVAVRFEGAGSR